MQFWMAMEGYASEQKQTNQWDKRKNKQLTMAAIMFGQIILS